MVQYSTAVLEFALVIDFTMLDFTVLNQFAFNYPMLNCPVLNFTALLTILIPDYSILFTWKVKHQRVLIHQSLLNQLLNHRNSLIYFSKNY